MPRPHGRGIFFCRPESWLCCLLLATALLYLPGLGGPFLFDDAPNLIIPISAWLEGNTGWQEIFLGNRSGLLGRPLSMLTFVANAVTNGLEPLAFKATNLAIHLLCGTLIYLLLARLLPRDPQLRARAPLAALLVSALWLLHPMQVSTVLYVVQRMAQLSTLFMLAALLAYVQGRIAFEQERDRAALTWLFLGVPTATVAAIFSKENGALAPLLCAVIEVGYFRATAQSPRPRAVKSFLALFLLLPAALVVGWYGAHWQALVDSYAERLFTLNERLLSQSRALFDYIGALLVPRGASLGVYTDDFQISHGLLDPPSTLFAILGLTLLIVVALKARMRMPALFTGIGLFLAGHVMESTIFPLELYFEHRNYLPSVGIFLAMAGLAGWAAQHLPHSDEEPRLSRLFAIGLTGLFAALTLATFARVTAWRHWPILAEQGARQHPQSMRAQLDQASILMAEKRYVAAQHVFDHIAMLDNPAASHVAAIDTVFLQCLEHGDAQPDAIARIPAIAGGKLQLAEMQAFEMLGNYLRKHQCANLTPTQLADLIVGIVNAAPQPPTLTAIWRNRYGAAVLYLADGQLHLAQQQAALAWMSGSADPAVGVFLANVYFINQNPASARTILNDVRRHLKSWDQRNLTLVAELQTKLDAEVRQSSPEATPAVAPSA